MSPITACLHIAVLTFALMLVSACAHFEPEQSESPAQCDMPKWRAHNKDIDEIVAFPDPGELHGEDPIEADIPGFEEDAEETIADPLEPWNRAMFTFNDKLFFWVLKPAAKGYNAVFPESIRQSVRNFFYNIMMPIRFVSATLQGDLKGAGNELARFGINSTLGLAGFFDPAKSKFNIEPAERDLGLTFGSYGVGEGFYLLWPILGPSSLRDTFGTAGDVFLSPVNYVRPVRTAIALDGFDYFNRVSLEMREYEDLKESSIEPYIALRDAYIQHRRSLVKGKQPESTSGWIQ